MNKTSQMPASRSPFGVLVVILLCCAAFAIYVLLTHPRPSQTRVGPVRSGGQSFSACLPYGHHHELVLGIPRAETNRLSVFTATLTFRGCDRVDAAVDVPASHAEPCNWLPQTNLQGYILTGANTNTWDHALVPGHRYRIDCQFNGDLSDNSSLWICCLQTEIDRWKARRNATNP